jgi:hypothetical protein
MFGTRKAHQRPARVGPSISATERATLAELSPTPLVDETLAAAMPIVFANRRWLGIDPELTAIADRIGQALLVPNDAVKFANYGSYTPWGIFSDDERPIQTPAGKTTEAVVASLLTDFPDPPPAEQCYQRIKQGIGPAFRQYIQHRDEVPQPRVWSQFTRPAALAIVANELVEHYQGRPLSELLEPQHMHPVTVAWQQASDATKVMAILKGLADEETLLVPATALAQTLDDLDQIWFADPDRRAARWQHDLADELIDALLL